MLAASSDSEHLSDGKAGHQMSQDGATSFTPYGQRILEAAGRDGNHVAIRDEDGKLTFRQLAACIGGFGEFLSARGVSRGDCIAICASNSVDYGVVYVAAAANGVVVAPLPQSATAESLAGMIGDCGARFVFADVDNAARLAAAACPVEIVRIEDARTKIPAPPEGRGLPEIDPQGVFNIIYSSGTTGRPKGIVQSHAMRDAHVELARSCGYDETSITLVSTPLYSNTSLVSFLPTLALGGTAILMRKFDARRFLELSAQHGVTHAMLVPVQYQRLLAYEDFNDYDLSSYRQKFCTSAPFPAELKRQVLDRWPGGLTEYYGMTEGGGLCILFAHKHPDKLHTVGRPAPGNDIRVIDEDGMELPPGQSGELVGRSGGMMRGYHNRPDDTAAAYWIGPEGERFMRTGDIGRFDDDGFLVLMDRRKDVVISGGFNIYPSDLEEVLRGHPEVEDVAVVGIPSSQWGETPVAFVVAPSATPAELLAFANGRLGKLQRISEVKLVDTLPRNAIGKVLKRTLRDSCRLECSKV